MFARRRASSPARWRRASTATRRGRGAARAGVALAGADRRRSTLVFLAGNLSLQYGAARLPANRTAVVMLTEVVFAVAVGDGARRRHADRPLAVGGALIVAGALLAGAASPAD